MGFWPVVLNVLRNSDVIILLVDARMPEITQNSEIIEKAEYMRRELIIVFNKIDLISKTDVAKIRKEFPESFFISSLKKIGVNTLKKYLTEYSEEWRGGKSLRVGIVGYPNIGKSTLINLLAPKARAKISKVSGTTKKTQWIREGKIRYMDSPGVIPFGDSKSKLGMTASKDPHKIRNPEKVAIGIIEYLEKRGGKTLEKHFGVESGNAYEMFEAIGIKKGFLLKGGIVNENRTAIKIISDWQQGKIKLG
ncbi:MAG: 50S ribosome-binding GTPase [Nanoarchaeota archaeon]|nr:50S ribosome-binding GTPase [Nanoarchaeota archaeon]